MIGITVGDPAGIGPEVVLKAVSDKQLTQMCDCVVIGDASHLRAVAAELSASGHSIDLDNVELYDVPNLRQPVRTGVDDPQTGRASAEYIEKAVELWRAGRIDAIATAPISKKAIALGGYDFPGHTEFLATLTDADNVAMSFFAGSLRVVLLSTHLPLRDAIAKVKRDRIEDLITFADHELERLLGRKVTLAVAALNPHASEDGMFGSEEHDEIEPAIDNCRAAGVDVVGPLSPDTVFLRGFRGEFDGVIALYHDQATIAAKSLSFGSAVNVTLGLPLVRTSVDHGTAYNIAGQGIADASSMSVAIRLAAELSRSFAASEST